MSRARRGKGKGLHVERLAGWVFADLLLVLFLLGVGSQLTQLTTAPEPEPTPKPTPTPTQPIGMSPDPIERTLGADLAAIQSPDPAVSQAERDRIRAEVANVTGDLDPSRVGMVLIWGDASQPGQGIELATAVGNELVPANPELFGGAAQKRVWWGQGQPGQVKLEMYLFE